MPNISQRPLDAYILLDTLPSDLDTIVVSPTTRFSMAIDYGNGHFYNGDEYEEAQRIILLLQRFYLRVEEVLADEVKR